MARISGLRSFAQRMRAYADDIPEQVNALKIALANEFATEVVPATPVDTGRARGNWKAGLNSAPSTQVVGAFGGRGSARFGAQGDGGLAQITSTTRRAKPGDKILITNNVPYINRLNDGYSNQAPKRFVQIALQRATVLIEKQRVRYGGKPGDFATEVINKVK